jgi:tetraacyldisaccharide 4'-kinase
MRPPEFWKADAAGRDAAPMLRALLTPLSWGYAWFVAQKMRRTTPWQAPIPVVCVGNLTLGGAGKTPVTRAVRAALGPGAHTLSRGYGGRIAGPLRVSPDMSAAEVGDEPLLHAHDGPAWIARDRVAGARAIAAAGARTIIMDDGFQNPSLAKALSLVVVDPGYGVGNGQVFPAGPLRERLAGGLARADAVILLYNGAPANDDAEAERLAWLEGFAKPLLRARIEPRGAAPTGPLVAFAGLARPEKFFDTLSGLGADLTDAIPFPDHHVYSDDDLELLAQLADERVARLITTEKDAARLAPDWRARVTTLPVTAQFEDPRGLDELLAPIKARMGTPS